MPMMDEESVRNVLEEYGAEYVSFTEDRSTWTPSQSAAGVGSASTFNNSASGSMINTPPPAASVVAGDRYDTSGSLSAPASGVANYNSGVVSGQAKQVEGEMRDRAADQTLNPFDDVAAKAEKAEGKLQEELAEEEEERPMGTPRY